MAAYVVVQEIVENEAKFSQYREKVMPILEQHGGRFLVRGGNMKVVKGEWPSSPTCDGSVRPVAVSGERQLLSTIFVFDFFIRQCSQLRRTAALHFALRVILFPKATNVWISVECHPASAVGTVSELL